MKEFKAGDKVYYPIKSTKVLTIRKLGDSIYPILVDLGSGNTYTLTIDGKLYTEDALPSIYHATPEMKTKLEDFYGVEFEAPPAKPTNREIIQAMLDKGEKSVSCWLSFVHKNPDADGFWGYIKQIVDGNHPFVDEKGGKYKYATPFDHTTLKPITELPD